MAVRPQTRLERAAYPVPFVFLDRSIRTRARKCTRGSFTSQVQRKCVTRLRVGPDARPILLGNQVFQPTKSFSQPSLSANQVFGQPSPGQQPTKSWPTSAVFLGGEFSLPGATRKPPLYRGEFVTTQ